MTFKSIITSFFLLMALTLPVSADSAMSGSSSPSEQGAIAIRCLVSGQSVRIQNASGFKVKIYNVTGVCIWSGHIDSEDKLVSLNQPKGIYILKVYSQDDKDKIVRKISLR
ncbi:MAG: T9SS type A sorting domain-containing protein [Prevotellaceae bacterium]|nr:T9SS type A sorting domain-containing protein [Prevotellaceae bacterium]MDY3295004.1 T9SS type A sorting domain-containing protein [Bacteroidaceae bacterium]